ncbi:MAG TPA: hypothetical protein VMJ32_01275 [Pirellulales bacterium]|nr:hypothetical protein [Pirellulales bacterium]
MTNEAGRTEIRSSQFKKYRSGIVALYIIALFAALEMGHLAVARADYDSATVVPGTRLVWHPVRPQRTDDSASGERSDDSASGKKDADKSADTTAEKKADCGKDDCVDSAKPADIATGKNAPARSANVENLEGNKVAGQKHPVIAAGYDEDQSGQYDRLRKTIRPAGGPILVGGANSSNVALTDPFGDNLPSVKTSHRIAMTPPEEIDSLPAPVQNEAAPLRIESAEQDSNEPTPPESLRSGEPKRTVDTYQTQISGPPAPDLLPGAEPVPSYTRQPAKNPEEACRDEYNQIKALTLEKLSIDITPPGANAKGDQVPFECSLSTDAFVPRNWQCLTYTWKASALCHKPLYFEEDSIERYGHSWGPLGFEDAQTYIHFFGDLVLLPYNVGVQTPCECDYALGYYRVGDCAPWICDPFPLSCRGLLTGAIGYCGVAALFP